MLRREIELKAEQLKKSEAEREREQLGFQEMISDLRQRLDREAEERRRTQAQLTALLTDQRPKQEITTPVKKSFWKNFLVD
ncbi:MAG: hypothetical protein P4L43_14765 [Syntrophobacteraceae bacterium]|nr:hypothetical protein [Syntrophobacteraceae bacterium]